MGVIIAIIAVGAAWWWLFQTDDAPSRVDRIVDRLYWIDGSVVVEAGPNPGAERFTLRSSGTALPLAEGCYMHYFQVPDGSLVYSLTDCEFKYSAAYHWRPGHAARELNRITKNSDGTRSPDLTVTQLGKSQYVLISEEGKDPVLLDTATDQTRTLKLAQTDSLLQLNPSANSPDATWTWFRDVAFNAKDDGTEILYTRCSGDRDRPTCSSFRQSTDPNSRPEVIRGPAGEAIIPMLRRGQFVFCSVGGEVSSVYRLDLESLSWRPVLSNASQMAFSPDGSRLAFADLHPNVWVLSYNDATGTFAQARRLTSFPAQRSHYYLDLAWLNDSDLIIRVDIDGTFAGGWRADLRTTSLDVLWQPKDATQDVFFDYVRKQKAGATYSVRIPRTTRVSAESALLMAKVLVTALALSVVMTAVVVRRRSTKTAPRSASIPA